MAISFNDFLNTIWQAILVIYTYLANTPYMLGLIIPLAFIVVLVLIRSKGGGGSPRNYYSDRNLQQNERPTVIQTRQGGGSGSGILRTILTAALSSVVGGIIIVYILPAIGYAVSIGLPLQEVIVILFVGAIIASILVYVYSKNISKIRVA